MNRQGVQEIGSLFRELGSISEQLAECQIDGTEPAILADNTQSLLEQLRQLSQEGKSKPLIRTVHHFACTGGTVISKCLSALPNVFLLSEVHPYSSQEVGGDTAEFSPSNLSRLARYASVPNCEELAERIFIDSVKAISEHVDAQGGKVILRDHTHSDYCFGTEYTPVPSLKKLLSGQFDMRSIATVRDPIDSYSSLKTNGWRHFQPNTFDEYCKRYLLFLENYQDEQIFRYEDFVSDPLNIMESICAVLDLKMDLNFTDIFSLFKVTGDSGRSGETIAARKRRQLETDLVDEILASREYEKLTKKLGYKHLECEK